MSLPELFSLIAKALECDPTSLTVDSGLNTHPAWDSLGHVKVMVALEQQYNVEINDLTIRRFEKMSNIIEFYQSYIASI